MYPNQTMNPFPVSHNMNFLDFVFKMMTYHKDSRVKIFGNLMGYLRTSPAVQSISQVQLFNSLGVRCPISRDTVSQAYESVHSLGNAYIESCNMNDFDKESCKSFYRQICESSATNTMNYLAQTGQLV